MKVVQTSLAYLLVFCAIIVFCVGCVLFSPFILADKVYRLYNGN